MRIFFIDNEHLFPRGNCRTKNQANIRMQSSKQLHFLPICIEIIGISRYTRYMIGWLIMLNLITKC